MIRPLKTNYPPQVGGTATIINTPERLWMAALLVNNHNRPLTVREFSSFSGLSLGFISKFSTLLRERGFLKPGRRLRLVEPGLLLSLVRDLYFFDGNTVSPYYSELSPDELLKKIKSERKKQYALTRMSGASLIAPYVRFQIVDIYLGRPEEIPYWKGFLNLVDVEISGNVNFVIPQDKKILTQVQTVKGLSIVNNVQLYLDLYKYPARGREQAEYLRERVLKI